MSLRVFLLMINIYVQLKSSKDYYIHVLKIFFAFQMFSYNLKKNPPINPKKGLSTAKRNGRQTKISNMDPPPQKKGDGGIAKTYFKPNLYRHSTLRIMLLFKTPYTGIYLSPLYILLYTGK